MTDMFAPAPDPPTPLGVFRILSSTAGIRVSPLCLGAMSIGDAWTDVSPSCNRVARRQPDVAGSSFVGTQSDKPANQIFSQFMGSMSKEQSFKLLDAFFEAGGNFIDTAVRHLFALVQSATVPRRPFIVTLMLIEIPSCVQNNYQNEQSEKWLGEWIKERKNRDLMVIATK